MRRTTRSPSASIPCSSSRRRARWSPGRAKAAVTDALVGAGAHEAAVAARAQREAQRVEQDRFAGARLAGQDGEALIEREVEPLDEHDVADGQSREHGQRYSRERPPRQNGLTLRIALLIQDSLFSSGAMPAGGEQPIGILVPLAARVVVAEHGGGRLGFGLDAERIVGLGQAVEGLGRLRRRLVVHDHRLEAIDGGDVGALLEVVAPDFHLLAGQMVAGEHRLGLGVLGVGRSGKAAADLLERAQGLLGGRLVALHVDDLLVVAERDQIIGVGRVLVAGMERDEALGRVDRIVIGIALVLGIGLHQDGLGGEARIGMLALDFLELLGGGAVLAGVQLGQALVVEVGDRLGIVGGGEVGRHTARLDGPYPRRLRSRRRLRRRRSIAEETRHARTAGERHRGEQDRKRSRNRVFPAAVHFTRLFVNPASDERSSRRSGPAPATARGADDPALKCQTRRICDRRACPFPLTLKSFRSPGGAEKPVSPAGRRRAPDPPGRLAAVWSVSCSLRRFAPWPAGPDSSSWLAPSRWVR